MRNRITVELARWAAAGIPVVLAGHLWAQSSSAPRPAEPPWQAFVVAAGADAGAAREALDAIRAGWRDQYTALIVDVARLLPSPRILQGGEPADEIGLGIDDEEATTGPPAASRRGEFAPVPRRAPGAEARKRLTDFLQRQTRQRFGDDLRAWRKWIWSLPAAPHADYAAFKAEVYARIDPAFRAFFLPV